MELNKTIQFYFRQPALESVSEPELQKAIQKYPYCASLQFLLLKKQQEEKSPEFAGQFERTTIYFHNPYHLRAQLSDQRFFQEKLPVMRQPIEESHIIRENVAQEEIETLTDQKTPEEILPKEEPETHFQPSDHIETKSFEESATQPGNTHDNVSGNSGLTADETHLSTDSQEDISNAGQKETKESFPPVPEPELRTDLLRMESPIPIPSIRDLSPQTDDTPVFEPYHTIDYFASQGIKLSQEQAPNDRLGRQLKSFTEWIKTMKRLPQANLEKQLMDAGNGEKIVAMAAGSVEPREIITETMAEVLVKQGNIEKAVDLYRKLSLAHPDKSTYFAARIEQLKHR
jgi:hypothetical protein